MPQPFTLTDSLSLSVFAISLSADSDEARDSMIERINAVEGVGAVVVVNQGDNSARMVAAATDQGISNLLRAVPIRGDVFNGYCAPRARTDRERSTMLSATSGIPKEHRLAADRAIRRFATDTAMDHVLALANDVSDTRYVRADAAFSVALDACSSRNTLSATATITLHPRH